MDTFIPKFVNTEYFTLFGQVMERVKAFSKLISFYTWNLLSKSAIFGMKLVEQGNLNSFCSENRLF